MDFATTKVVVQYLFAMNANIYPLNSNVFVVYEDQNVVPRQRIYFKYNNSSRSFSDEPKFQM